MHWKSALRWVIVGCVLTGIIAFPRGITPQSGGSYVPHSPILWFHWPDFWSSLSSFFQPLLHFSLGTTFAGNSVFDEVLAHVCQSTGLLLLSIVMVVVLGITKGMYDGLRAERKTIGTRISAILQGAVESLPDFFIVNFLILFSFFLLRKGIPVYFIGSTEFFTGTFIPAMIMAAAPIMYLARMVRMNIEEQFGQQYLVTAEAKGLTRSRVVLRHVLPNCVPTVLSTLVPALGMLFSNLVIVEYLFYKKGIVGGLVAAMGIGGSQAIYNPNTLDLSDISYYAFDPHLVFAYVLACVLLIFLFWGAIRAIFALLGYRGFTNPYASGLLDETSQKRWSAHLTVGVVMLVVIVVIGLFRHVLPIMDPEHQEYIEFLPGGSMSAPPYPPFSPHHLLGTDRHGRDLLSRAIYGILPTFGYALSTVAGTLLVSALLAVLSSVWKVPGIRFIIQVWNSLFSVVPGVIAAFIILNIPDVYWFGMYVTLDGGFWSVGHTVLFLTVLAVIEVGRVSAQLQFALDESCSKSYMEAATIAGNTPWTALWIHHMVPLRNAILEQLVVTFSRVLLLFATLGFLYQPIQQAWLSRGDFLDYNITSMDWGSLIAQDARDFYSNGWMLFPPVLLIAYTVLSMNLLRTGIRKFTGTVPISSAQKKSSLQRIKFLIPARNVSEDV